MLGIGLHFLSAFSAAAVYCAATAGLVVLMVLVGLANCVQRPLGPWPLAQDHPVDAKAIPQLAEPGGEERFLQGHEHFAAVAER